MVSIRDAGALWNQTGPRREPGAATALFFFNCAVLALTLVLGSPGNLWVCWVVFRFKCLQTFNNALLVSLAAGDLLKCCVDTPLLLASLLLSGAGGRVPASACALQRFTFALCGCVQLLTLVGISVERFQAVAFPFQTERRRARVRLWIPSIWACGAVLALVSLTLSEQALLYTACRPHLGEPGAVRLSQSDPFGPCVLVPLWGLSLAVIVVHYLRIFKVVRRHRKKVFSRGVQLRPAVSQQVCGWLSVPASDPRTAPPGSSGPPPPHRRAVLLVAEASGAPPRRGPEIVGAVCLLTAGARARVRKRAEGRMALRFGYIIVAFTLLWAPLPVILLMDVFSGPDGNRLQVALETSAVVLTGLQAAVDPLLYTLATRQFRSQLGKILCSVQRWPLKRRA
ncbi:D(4) dopamine receptor-like [Clinocottus analis]|uniref:D(4) dopamine receptor-like n=1 Tax=Clinocottus analis TaxID=304258 RepID=UPI0035C0EC8F